MSRAGSSRWSPTPEQVMILEQLYKSGIRTPSASQIQHITTHLCFYGRIEGKNVFYWFQNHKARDRQKLRRKLNKQLQLQQQHQMLAHQCQVSNHQDNKAHHHWSFGGFDSYPGSSSSSALQVPFYNPDILLSHQGETSSETWKSMQRQQISEAMELDKTKMTSSFYYNDNNNNGMMSRYCWSDVVDVNETSSSYYCCTSRPLKTLDLFPTTSTKLKENRPL